MDLCSAAAGGWLVWDLAFLIYTISYIFRGFQPAAGAIFLEQWMIIPFENDISNTILD